MDLDIFEDLLIVAIFRDGELIIPYGNIELQEDDILNIIGSLEAINKFSERFHFINQRNKIKK